MLLGNFRIDTMKIFSKYKGTDIFKYKDNKALDRVLWRGCGISGFKGLLYKKAYIVIVQKLL